MVPTERALLAGSPLERILLSVRGNAFEYYPRLRRIKGAVERHCEPPLSLAAAARIASLERKYFSTYFHEKVGVPFSTWIRCQQILAAIELMEAEDLSVAEIARLSGFAEIRTFERTFKHLTQLTPCQFKRRVASP